MMLVYLEMLGKLRVVRGETTVDSFRTHKAALLLAYLALTPGEHSREKLCALLWPRSEGNPRRNLTNTLALLRTALEPLPGGLSALMIETHSTVGLRDGSVASDVGDFDACIGNALRETDPTRKSALLEEALTLYGGELLPGKKEDVSPGSIGYWLHAERLRLETAHGQALLGLAQICDQRAERESALRYALRAAETSASASAQGVVEQLSRPSVAATASRSNGHDGHQSTTPPVALLAVSRVVAGALALMPCGATAETLVYLAGLPGVDRALTEMLEHGLVCADRTDDCTRYRLRPDVHGGTFEPLTAREQRDMWARILRHARSTLFRHTRGRLPRGDASPNQIDCCIGSFAAALHATIEAGGRDLLVSRCLLLAYALDTRWPEDSDALEVLERHLSTAALSDLMRFRLHCDAGRIAHRRGALRRAEEHARRALALSDGFHDIPSRGTIIDARVFLAQTLHHQERDLEAALSFERAIDEIRRDVPRPDRLAAALTNYACSLSVQGEPGRARAALEEAIALVRDAGRGEELGTALYEYGGLLRLTGDYVGAARALNESWRMRRQRGDDGGQIECLRALGALRADQGMFVEARHLLEDALAVDLRPSSPMSRAAAVGLLGWVAFLEDDLDRAAEPLQDALAVWQSAGHRRWQGICHARLAALAIARRDCSDAARHCDACLDLCSGSHSLGVQATARCLLGRLALSKGRWTDAAQHVGQSLGAREQLGDALGVAECTELQAWLLERTGSDSDASALTDKARAMRTAMGTPLPPVWARWTSRVLRRAHSRPTP